VILVQGIRTTDPIGTFIECAGSLSLVELVVLGDALVKRYRIKAAALLRACRMSTDYYARAAQRAAEYVRDGVDSPMETRLRMLIVLAGLPEPEVDFRIYNDDGTLRRRFDLYYPSIGLIVEYDGRQHAESPSQWNRDLERREEFDDDGRRIIVVTAEGIFVEPARTLHRVRRQLVLRGLGDVPQIQPDWEEHFPTRVRRSA
jgi:very-short-patch-repair endonuclease